MKLRITFFLILFSVIAVSVNAKPVINNWVVDEANILSPNAEAELTGLFESVEKQTTAQMAVVTVKTLEGESIEQYAIELAQGKLGTAKEDNGLLIFVAVDDREYRIEVGQGLEGQLNDARVGRIGREYFVPNFQNGDYDKGILEGARVIADVITGNQTVISQLERPETNVSIPIDVIVYFIILAIFIIISIIRRKKGKGSGGFFFIPIGFGRGRGGGGFGGFSGGGGNFSGGGSSGRW